MRSVARPKIGDAQRVRIFRRDGWTCQYCGEWAGSLDHIIPVAYGGKNDDANLVACCKRCNSRLSTKVFDSLQAKREYIASVIHHSHR